jgi:Ni/Co efflux regulator RcnB
MTRMLAALILSAVALSPFAAAAGGPSHCPPGLARKNPPCVPPGQAKSWRMGERYDGPWSPVDWWRHDLPRPDRGETWMRVGPDVVVRVDDATRAIVDVVRLAGVVLSN